MHNVKMDNAEFEKYFDVKCEDKVLLMRILTANIMKKLMKLYKKHEMSFEINIIKDKIYIRFNLSAFIYITEESLSKKSILYNYEVVTLVTETAKVITEAINELEV